MSSPTSFWRVADANLNRCAEGLRVLEEVARFLLNDATLSAQCKTLRHQLGAASQSSSTLLYSARDVAQDVGASAEEGLRGDVTALVQANAKRAQESLRVLEEWAKLPDSPPEFSAAMFAQARFSLYELERSLLGRVLRRAKAARVQGLYLIIDPEALGGRTEAEVTQAALVGGAQVIQLRDKRREKGLALPVAQQLQALCARHGALFIVNDDPDLALAVGADGVHLGQKDLPVHVARQLLAIDMLVGCSTAVLEEAQNAEAEGADYIAVGAMFPSPSKADTRPAGVETLRQVRAITLRPLVAIGGITEENVTEIIQAGADAVAIISAVAGAPDVKEAARRIVQRIQQAKALRQALRRRSGQAQDKASSRG